MNHAIYLALEPFYKKEELAYYRVHLVNHHSIRVPFTYEHKLNEEQVFNLKKTARPESAFFLDTFKLSDLNHNLELIFEVHLDDETFGKELRFKPKELHKEPRFDPVVHAKVISFSLLPRESREKDPLGKLSSDDVERLRSSMMGDGERRTAVADSPLYREQAMVIDLHIEHLVNDSSGMNNSEIIAIQMREFETSFDRAMNKGVPKLVVVHGVGKGTLKEHIFEFCRANPHVSKYHNSHDNRFGFGATEIIFD